MNPRILAQAVRRPVYTGRLVLYRLYELSHPNEPWIAQGAIRFLDAELDRQGNGLEWGSGRSTQWFGARSRHLTTVEHDHRWAEEIRGRLARARVENVELVETPLDHPESEGTRPVYEVEPRYVAVARRFGDASLSFVLVDGHYRQACIRAVLGKLRPGGLLVLDNSDWLPREEWGVPKEWLVVHESRNVRTQTTIWRKPAAA